MLRALVRKEQASINIDEHPEALQVTHHQGVLEDDKGDLDK